MNLTLEEITSCTNKNSDLITSADEELLTDLVNLEFLSKPEFIKLYNIYQDNNGTAIFNTYTTDEKDYLEFETKVNNLIKTKEYNSKFLDKLKE